MTVAKNYPALENGRRDKSLFL